MKYTILMAVSLAVAVSSMAMDAEARESSRSRKSGQSTSVARSRISNNQTQSSNTSVNKRFRSSKFSRMWTGGTALPGKGPYGLTFPKPPKFPNPTPNPNPGPIVELPTTNAPKPQPLPEPTEPEPTPTDPAPTDPTDQNPQTVNTKTVYLRARQIGPFFRPYVAISRIPGEISEIEIPEGNGQSLDVYFVKPGYKLFEYASNPEATVMLTSGQTSTPSQISELFDTARQNRHVKFVAFVRTSQGNRPKSFAINVSSINTDE